MLRIRPKPPAASKSRRLTISRFAHNQALHYLARREEYRLPGDVREQLVQVVEGFTGRCDEDAARRGLDWMREQERRQGRTAMLPGPVHQGHDAERSRRPRRG